MTCLVRKHSISTVLYLNFKVHFLYFIYLNFMLFHPSFFVKKQVYTKYGAYSIELSLAADYEFMLRVLYKHRISTVFLNEVLVKMRAGGMGNRSISQRIKANREDRQAWRINGLKPGLFTLFAKPLRKLIQFSITRQWLF